MKIVGKATRAHLAQFGQQLGENRGQASKSFAGLFLAFGLFRAIAALIRALPRALAAALLALVAFAPGQAFASTGCDAVNAGRMDFKAVWAGGGAVATITQIGTSPGNSRAIGANALEGLKNGSVSLLTAEFVGSAVTFDTGDKITYRFEVLARGSSALGLRFTSFNSAATATDSPFTTLNSVTFTTVVQTIPAGTAAIRAQANIGTAMDTGTVEVTATCEAATVATTTALASDLNPSTFGQAVTLTATVSGSPSVGTVAFKDNGTDIAGCSSRPVTSGTATCTTTALSATTHSNITAVYAGGTGFLGSTSPALTPAQVVNPSTDATLSNLTASAGTLSPTFTSATTAYSFTVPTATTSTTVTPTVNNPGATVTVDGNAVPTGTPSGSIALAEGDNVIDVIVAPQSGATKTYTITVTRLRSATHFSVSAPATATTEAAFSNLIVTARDVNNATATGYTGTVTFTSSDGAAILPGNTTLTNGVGTFTATFNTAGTQTITATDTVTAITGVSAGTNVTLPPPTISSLSITEGLAHASTTPASLTINGTNFDTTPANNIVKFGTNTATVTGATATTLTVTPPANATFGRTDVSVEVNGQTGTALNAYRYVTPPTVTASFSPTSVANNVASTLTLTIANPNGVPLNGVTLGAVALPTALTASALGGTCANRSLSGNALSLGSTNNFTGSCTITAQVRSTEPATYSYTTGTVAATGTTTTAFLLTGATATTATGLTVAGSTDSTLSALVPSAGTLSPGFAAGTTSYTVAVPYATTSATVTATTNNAGATLQFGSNPLQFAIQPGTSGNPSPSVTLTPGTPQAINTRVIPQDSGAAVTVYVVTFTRALEPTVAISTPADAGTVNSGNLAVQGTAANATTVSITVDGTPYGPISVTGGTWSFAVPTVLANGAHTATAVSTNSFADTSTTATSNFTVARGASTATLATPTGIVAGSNASYSVTVTGSAPTGTVTFLDGATAVCSNVALAGGNASCTHTNPSVGAHSITATYSGDANNDPSTASAVTQNVYAALTTTQAVASISGSVNVALTPATPVTAAGGEGALSYALSGGTLPTGLSFSTTTGQISGTPTTALAATVFTVTVTDHTPGTAQTSAKTFTLTVAAGNSTTTLGATSPVVAGTAVDYTATVTGASPTGTVAFFDGGSPIGGCGTVALSGGTATCNTTPAAGTRTITATYSGDANNATSTAPGVTQTVYALLTTTQAVSSATGTVGTALTTVTPVTASGGEGTISYALSGGTLPTGLSFSTTTGQLSGTPSSSLAATLFTVTASDQTPGTAQTSAKTFTLTINAAASGTSLATPSAVIQGASTSYTATVTGTSPTGTVAFFDGGLPIAGCGTVALSGGSASCTTTASVAGSRTITATYSGDSNNATSTAPGVTQTVYALLTTTQAVSSVSGAVGTPLTAVAPVTAAGGEGTLSYALSGGTLPTGLNFSTTTGQLSGTPSTALAATVFTVTVTDQTPGTAQISAKTFTLSVGQSSQTITFTAPADAPVSASPLTLAATASSGLTVSFASNSSTICTVSGTTLTLVATGTCSITASQAGDSNFAAAAPVTQTFTVIPETLVITHAAATGLIVGGSYSQANPASGGVAPYAYTLGAGAFVPGTTVNPATGTVSGTPTVAGSFSYIVRVTDSQSTAATADTPVTTVNIAKGTQTLAFTSTAPSATVGGAPYTVTATASSGLGVTFTLDVSSSGCALSGNSVTFTASGTCVINAEQAGDSNWNPASTIQQSFTVGAATAVTSSVSFSPGSLGVGSSGTLTITFRNSNVLATRNVAPLLNGSALLVRTGGVGGSCGVTGSDAGANFQFDPFSIPSGSCTVTLDYTGATAGASSGYVLGAFTPSGYPTTLAAPGNPITVRPTIASVSPVSGPVSQVVMIAGTGFSTTPGNNLVKFGSVNGTVTGASATSLTVTAPASGTGTVGVTVTVNGQTSTDSASYTFIAAPIAANKAGVMVAYESTGTAIDLAPSITGPHGSIAIGTAPAHGTTSIAGDIVTYTPTAGYYGPDSFTYTATGPGGTSNVATVDLNVGNPPAPVAADRNGVAVPHNSTGTAIDLSTAITGVHATIAIDTAPAHGTTSIAGDVVTYTPTTGYYGPDSFTFTATGPGGTSNVATVAITIGNPPAPVAANRNGVAVPYASSGTAIDLSASITGVHASVALGIAPAHGTVTIAGDVVTYTPAATYYGPDSFTYTATGPGGTSAPATVSLTVATPAAPVAADRNGVAVAYASSGTAIDLSASITGVHSSIAIGTAPARGTATIAGDVVTYTPVATYFGTDSFTYTATGPGGTSNVATVTVGVGNPPAPVAADKTGVAVAHNSSGTAIDLSGSITGVHASIAIGTAPAHGTATIAGDVVTYVPIAGYYGADSFTYTATGAGGTSNAATVTLTVGNPPAPVVADKSGVAVAHNSAGTAIDLSGSITGVHTLIQIATQPAHGTVSIAGDVVTYTPATGYYGADSFTYTATGPGDTSSAATVTVTVANPPPPTQAPGTGSVAGSSSVNAGTSVDIDLSALVTGEYTSIQIETPPAHGTVTLRTIGTTGSRAEGTQGALAGPRTIATYRPAVGYIGTDTFTFYATGPGGRSAAATISVTVVGGVPVAQAKTAATGDGEMVSVELTTGATEGPFTGAAVVSIAPANSATTRIVDSGSGASRSFRLELTPNPRYSGNVTVSYTLTNSYGTSAPATVTVAVTARPNPTADANVRGISDAQAETTRRFARSQVSNFMRRTEQLHGSGGQGGATMGVTLNSRDGRGYVRERPAFDASALEITERMRPLANDPMLGRVANLRDRGGLRADMLGSGAMGIVSQPATHRIGAVARAGAGAIERPVLSEDSGEGSGERKIGSVAIWSGGAIDIGTQDATTQRSKITATTSGLSAGMDVKLAEGVVIGLGGGYGNDVSHIGGSAARVRSTSSLFAAYASVSPGSSAFIDGMVGIGDLSFSTRRAVATLNVNALGSRDGRFTVGAIAAGLDRQSESVRWSVYGRGEFMNAELKAYTETGAGRMNLRFDARDVSSLTGTLGARIEFTGEARFATITPRLRVEWNHEFADTDAQMLDYADIPGASLFSLTTQGWSRDQFQLSAGARFAFARRWSFDIEAGYRGGSGQQAGTLRLQLSKEF